MFCVANQMKSSFDNIKTNIPIMASSSTAIQPRNERKEKKSETPPGVEQTDMNLIQSIGTLNLNGYATRKTIAHGLLDLALLSANASQLKSVLNRGADTDFYALLLTLIIISIAVQILQAVIICVLAFIFNINKVDDQDRANIVNNVLVLFTVISVAINVVISAFDMHEDQSNRN